MLTRYLVVRPDIPWIQGDIPAPTPRQAVDFLETRLRIPPDAHHEWFVYEAPRGFPPQGSGWSGGDPRLMELLDRQEPVASFEQRRVLAPNPQT